MANKRNASDTGDQQEVDYNWNGEKIREDNIARNNNYLLSKGFGTGASLAPKKKRQLTNFNCDKYKCVHGCDWRPDIICGKPHSKQFYGHQSQCSYFKQTIKQSSCAGRTRQNDNLNNNDEININYDGYSSDSDRCTTNNSDMERIEYDSSISSDESEQAPNPVVTTDPSLPSMFILNYQRMLESTLSKENLVNIRCKKLNKNVEHIKADDYIRLASIGSLVGISEKNGDQILKIIQEIIHNNGSNIELPQTWRSVNRVLKQDAKRESTVTPILIPLNPEIWGELNLSSKGADTKLKIPFAWKYNFLEVIGEKFLSSNPDGVSFKPDYDNLNEY